MQLSRRGFISGLLAVVSAPAIARVESIMPVRFLPASLPGLVPAVDELVPFVPTRNTLLTIDMITREAVKLFQNSNKFIQEMDRQYARDFAFISGEQWPAPVTRISFAEWAKKYDPSPRILT